MTFRGSAQACVLGVARDGCRAVVAIQNTFPEYVYFFDGWQVDRPNAPTPNFSPSTVYDIELGMATGHRARHPAPDGQVPNC